MARKKTNTPVIEFTEDVVELGAVASLPDADHAGWGEAIGYCEGVRLVYDENGCRGDLLRLPDAQRLIEN